MLVSPRRNRNRAFTLIELLVVIAIIAVLIGLLVPAVQKVRQAAAKLSCQNNMHQLGIACAMYANDRSGRFPIGAQSTPQGGGASWLVLILPYIEQDNLYQTYLNETKQFTLPFTSGITAGSSRIPLFYCPSGQDATSIDTPGFLTTHYYGNMGPGSGTAYDDAAGVNVQNHNSNAASSTLGVLLVDLYSPQGMGIKIAEIKDGTSSTILIGERSYTERGTNSYTSWTRGFAGTSPNIFTGALKNVSLSPFNSASWNGSTNMQDISFGSNHSHGANFAMCDGSVHYINDDVSMALMVQLATRNGGEAVQLP